MRATVDKVPVEHILVRRTWHPLRVKNIKKVIKVAMEITDNNDSPPRRSFNSGNSRLTLKQQRCCFDNLQRICHVTDCGTITKPIYQRTERCIRQTWQRTEHVFIGRRRYHTFICHELSDTPPAFDTLDSAGFMCLIKGAECPPCSLILMLLFCPALLPEHLNRTSGG